MWNKIKEFGKKQSFQPNLLSIFLNPMLFQRWYLFQALKTFAPRMIGTMLDFGCGRKPYKDLFINVKNYVGLDIEVSGHSHEESLVDVYYDGNIIPFDDKHFDSIYCSEVIEHIFNIEEVLPEINRVLKHDGMALFTFPFAWQEHEQPYDFARYTSFAAKAIFEKHGFEVIEFKKNGHFAITVMQLWINYIFCLFLSKNRYLNTLLTMIFITPFNILGLLFCLLPKNESLYITNLLLLRKQ
jgi:SAM-dependent methyltransferase